MKTVLVLFLFSIFLLNNAYAQSDDVSYKEKMSSLSDFVTKQCDKVKTEGSETSEKLSVDGSLETQNLLKKVASLTGNANGNLENQSYSGLDRKQLLEALKNENSCKEEMTKILLPVFFSKKISDEPVQNPDEIYQYQNSVAKAGTVSVRDNAGKIFFRAVVFNKHPNIDESFSFRGMKIECPEVKNSIPRIKDPENTIEVEYYFLFPELVCNIER